MYNYCIIIEFFVVDLFYLTYNNFNNKNNILIMNKIINFDNYKSKKLYELSGFTLFETKKFFYVKEIDGSFENVIKVYHRDQFSDDEAITQAKILIRNKAST